MARRVFFSFHYERDIWRANQVRNAWVVPGNDAAGFWDASLWEEARKQGDDAIQRMIDDAIKGTSVTVVLIGPETHARRWVKYELQKSVASGNGFLGIKIHNLKDPYGNTDTAGPNPLDSVVVSRNGRLVFLSSVYPTYDWVLNDGYKNVGAWIENAARLAGR